LKHFGIGGGNTTFGLYEEKFDGGKMKVMEKGQCPSKVTGVSLCITSGILDSSRIPLFSNKKKVGSFRKTGTIPFTILGGGTLFFLETILFFVLNRVLSVCVLLTSCGGNSV